MNVWAILLGLCAVTSITLWIPLVQVILMGIEWGFDIGTKFIILGILTAIGLSIWGLIEAIIHLAILF